MASIVAQISPKGQKPFSPSLLGAFSLRKPHPIYLKITSLHKLNLLVCTWHLRFLKQFKFWPGVMVKNKYFQKYNILQKRQY
jgi:hypothetical protein